MRDKIKEKLEETKEEVFYGAGRFKDRDSWDCIVYGKRRLKREKTNSTTIWFVAIVKEEFIPEGMEECVINKMRELGLKKTDEDARYGYAEKSGECMAEICTIEFYKAEKGC